MLEFWENTLDWFLKNCTFEQDGTMLSLRIVMEDSWFVDFFANFMKYYKITRVDLEQGALSEGFSKRGACYSDCGLCNDSILMILTFIQFLTVQTLKDKLISRFNALY